MGTVAGPPFVSVIRKMMGGAANVAVQGIDYPATIPGFLNGGDKKRSVSMAKMDGQIRAKCPDTALFMAAYSQGGQLFQNASDMLSAQESAFFSITIIFGDPDNGDAVGEVPAANTKIICANGDLICAGKAIVLPPHLSYGRNADEAAQFVLSTMAA
ncbi:alpha/beta-hydrolase, partial [Clathrospora elynae]